MSSFSFDTSGITIKDNLGNTKFSLDKRMSPILYNVTGVIEIPPVLLDPTSKYVDRTDEFVLVNNGSTDDSAKFLAQVRNPKIRIVNLKQNVGYGGGILAGLKTLETEYVGWMHADLQTDLRQSLLGLNDLEFDFFKGIRSGRTFMERLLSAGMGAVCSLLFRTSLIEINAQPTIMKKELFKSWVNPPLDFCLDLYSLLIAKKRKVTILRSKFYFSKRASGQSTWNFGLTSRIKMISRTLRYAVLLLKTGVK